MFKIKFIFLRFSSALSKKLDKDRRRKTSISYNPNDENTKLPQRQNRSENPDENFAMEHQKTTISTICDGIDELQTTVKISDNVFED